MCGIFGVHGHPDATHLAQLGLYSLQHRGQESVGVVSIDDAGTAHAVRSMGTLNDRFSQELAKVSGTAAVGHTRYSTAGSSTIDNAQPVVARSKGGYITLAHNGNLTNAAELRLELEDQG
jgi:amidophosphoribosyltransferase